MNELMPSKEIAAIYSDIYKKAISTWSDNVIPGMVTAYSWGVEPGKFMYQSTFGHVPTCIYMSYRPNE
jgi:hypothetical protein